MSYREAELEDMWKNLSCDQKLEVLGKVRMAKNPRLCNVSYDYLITVGADVSVDTDNNLRSEIAKASGK